MKARYISSPSYRKADVSLAYKVVTVSMLVLLAIGFLLAFGGII